jgi:hypothetical protein
MKKNQGRHGGTLQTPEKGDPSPNPAGKPKGTLNTATRMKRLFELVVERKNPLTGKKEIFTGAELLDMALFKKALKGDVNAYREIMDRVEGKVTTTINTNEYDAAKQVKALFPTLKELRESLEEDK